MAQETKKENPFFSENEPLRVLYEKLRFDKKVLHQTDMAKKLGITRAHLSSIMSGHQRIPGNMAKKIKTVFGIAEEDWFEKTNNSQKSQTTSTTGEQGSSAPMDERERIYLSIIQDCARAAADSATAAKDSAATAKGVMGRIGESANSTPSLEKKVDRLFEEIDSVRAGMVATRNFLFRQVAKQDDRAVTDVENEYMDNDLAEALGLPSKGSIPAQNKSEGKKGKVQPTS